MGEENCSLIQMKWLRLPDKMLKIYKLFSVWYVQIRCFFVGFFFLFCFVFCGGGDKFILCFWYRLFLAETAPTGGRVNQRTAKRTRGFSLAAREKCVSNLTATAERNIKSLFRAGTVFFQHMCRPYFLSGASGDFGTFKIYFIYLILYLFFKSLQFLMCWVSRICNLFLLFFRITLSSSPVGSKNKGREVNKASNFTVQDCSKQKIFVGKE